MNLLAVPGLEKMTPAFLRGLVDLAERNGWDPSGIALVIAEESGFNPAAKNPNGSASGLIQFIESTAKSLGTTTAAIRQMSAVEQLPLVEKFFQMSMGKKIPERIEDYILAPLGRPDMIGRPDETVIYTKGSPEYDANAGLDRDGDGTITVGDMRARMKGFVDRAKGYVVVGAAAGAEILFWLVGAGALYLKTRKKRAS